MSSSRRRQIYLGYLEREWRFHCESRRRAGFVIYPTPEPIHPPGTQLLLWDDINQSAESLQKAKENMYRRAYGGNII